MSLRLLWLGALALVLFGLYAASGSAKNGCLIDPDGSVCKPGSGTSAAADAGSSMDPNG